MGRIGVRSESRDRDNRGENNLYVRGSLSDYVDRMKMCRIACLTILFVTIQALLVCASGEQDDRHFDRDRCSAAAFVGVIREICGVIGDEDVVVLNAYFYDRDFQRHEKEFDRSKITLFVFKDELILYKTAAGPPVFTYLENGVGLAYDYVDGALRGTREVNMITFFSSERNETISEGENYHVTPDNEMQHVGSGFGSSTRPVGDLNSLYILWQTMIALGGFQPWVDLSEGSVSLYDLAESINGYPGHFFSTKGMWSLDVQKKKLEYTVNGGNTPRLAAYFDGNINDVVGTTGLSFYDRGELHVGITTKIKAEFIDFAFVSADDLNTVKEYRDYRQFYKRYMGWENGR